MSLNFEENEVAELTEEEQALLKEFTKERMDLDHRMMVVRVKEAVWWETIKKNHKLLYGGSFYTHNGKVITEQVVDTSKEVLE